jgi:transcriptional regulator with XRE-family HTH domain
LIRLSCPLISCLFRARLPALPLYLSGCIYQKDKGVYKLSKLLGRSNIAITVKEIRLSLGISQREFSKRIYITQSFYGDIELGKKTANDRIIQLIASQFNVNKNWIKTGEGEMFTSPPPDIRRERLIEIYNELPEWLQDCLIEQSNLLLKRYKKQTGKDECRSQNEKGDV